MSKSGLYIQLFSVHGLIRSKSPELGRDADTGGQIKYVLELAKSLAEHAAVDQVDLVTRLIADKAVSDDYACQVEPLADKARLVRLQCGGRKYIRKELLWPHMDEFVDRNLKYIKSVGRVPDIFHGHYADGGYVAKELASIFGLPFIFTGHSMGRHKKNKLIGEGLSEEEINRRYHIDHRIDIEEKVISESELIITSTSHEIERQYGLYKNFNKGNYKVYPPGIDVDTFYPYYDVQLDFHRDDDESSKQARMALMQELHRFWVNPSKPFILALCRPDQRKNISGLITAYGEDKSLQAIANLAIFAGIRKNINEMESNERNVLTEMLLLMDRYDLYGKMAIPKKHDFSLEVPELYRMCADSHGLFVNPALVEPFGLTLIEAASCGVPIVATKDGGPADIIQNCENGTLVDPTKHKEIADACRQILVDKDAWEVYSRNGINGVREYYVWTSHCEQYVKSLQEVQKRMPGSDLVPEKKKKRSVGHRLTGIRRLVISDIDNTLVGDHDSLAELLQHLEENRKSLAWGVATGRSFEMTMDALEEHAIPVPDIIICSVGTEIFYGAGNVADKGWQQHLAYQWKPQQVKSILQTLPFLELQEDDAQRRFKISYYIDPEKEPDWLAKVHYALQRKNIKYKLVFSHGQFLDVLPYRASKGKAVRYLSYKWELPLRNILVCGNSGNDEDMLRGNTCGLVVANYSEELESLRGLRQTYFSDKPHAAGIIDGLQHYRFLEKT